MSSIHSSSFVFCLISVILDSLDLLSCPGVCAWLPNDSDQIWIVFHQIMRSFVDNQPLRIGLNEDSLVHDFDNFHSINWPSVELFFRNETKTKRIYWTFAFCALLTHEHPIQRRQKKNERRRNRSFLSKNNCRFSRTKFTNSVLYQEFVQCKREMRKNVFVSFLYFSFFLLPLACADQKSHLHANE